MRPSTPIAPEAYTLSGYDPPSASECMSIVVTNAFEAMYRYEPESVRVVCRFLWEKYPYLIVKNFDTLCEDDEERARKILRTLCKQN